MENLDVNRSYITTLFLQDLFGWALVFNLWAWFWWARAIMRSYLVPLLCQNGVFFTPQRFKRIPINKQFLTYAWHLAHGVSIATSLLKFKAFGWENVYIETQRWSSRVQGKRWQFSNLELLQWCLACEYNWTNLFDPNKKNKWTILNVLLGIVCQVNPIYLMDLSQLPLQRLLPMGSWPQTFG